MQFVLVGFAIRFITGVCQIDDILTSYRNHWHFARHREESEFPDRPLPQPAALSSDPRIASAAAGR